MEIDSPEVATQRVLTLPDPARDVLLDALQETIFVFEGHQDAHRAFGGVLEEMTDK